MPKAWFPIKIPLGSRGFSAVEVLLAATIFGFLTTALVGAFIYGREATDGAGTRAQAVMLAEEGTEAVRNIRDANYTNLVDGTYGLAQSGGQWALSGSQDTSGIYTRSTTIAAAGVNRKRVTTTVSWTVRGVARQTSVSTQLTKWSTAKTWASPYAEGPLDLAGTNVGVKVATQGNYAYVVRTDGTPDFVVVDISTPSAPVVVGSMTVVGTPTNVFVSGNYAYVTSTSDTGELQIINVTNPALPVAAGTYDAPGAGDGRGVYVVGTVAYVSRAANAANNEFVIVNVATPTAPVRIGGYNLNVTMYEVFVSGATAFIATSSDTQEILVLNLLIPALLTLGTSVNLPGTTDATTVDGFGSTLLVGQGTSFTTISFLTPLIPLISGSLTLSGTINDVAGASALNLGFAATSDTAKQFQVINVANTASPSLFGTTALASGTLTGLAYNAGLNRVPAVGTIPTQETTVFGPN